MRPLNVVFKRDISLTSCVVPRQVSQKLGKVYEGRLGGASGDATACALAT
jgi:hypothetical protein